MNDKTERQQIWESYLNNEQKGMSAGRIGHLHGDRPEKGDREKYIFPSTGEAGKPWGDETKVLEGVECDCETCDYWVVGDLCKAESISIMKGPDGQGPVCATYTQSDA